LQILQDRLILASISLSIRLPGGLSKLVGMSYQSIFSPGGTILRSDPQSVLLGLRILQAIPAELESADLSKAMVV
jgi:hypothetical protein